MFKFFISKLKINQNLIKLNQNNGREKRGSIEILKKIT